MANLAAAVIETVFTVIPSLIKSLGMGERAARCLEGLIALQTTTAPAHRLPVTPADLHFLAKFAGNSDTDILGTTSKETSRAAGKSLFELNEGLRLTLAPAWRYGMATIDPDKLFKTLQKVYGVAPAAPTAPETPAPAEPAAPAAPAATGKTGKTTGKTGKK